MLTKMIRCTAFDVSADNICCTSASYVAGSSLYPSATIAMAGAGRAFAIPTPSRSICGAATVKRQSAPAMPRPAHAWYVIAGYAGVTMSLNSVAMLSATESPIKRMDPTGAAAGSAGATGNASYHGAYKSKSPRKFHPLRVTEPAVPVIVTEVVYPFHSPPSPSCVVVILRKTPMVGYIFCS